MKKPSTAIIIIACVVVVIIGCLFWGIGVRNGLVTQSEGVEAAWSQVENEYQRRLDLIPNLVETVKGYADHESETFENVTRARAGLDSALSDARASQGTVGADGNVPAEQDLNAYMATQGRLKDALSIYVNAVHEAYPTLVAGEQFRDLQTQLEGTENRIKKARQDYITTVRDYNVAVRRFPASMIASMCGFDVKPQFKADEAAATAPKVSF